jgi:glyoxylase-like metal-dependent hydrolase (beta-lactamase superfamily II)
MCEARFFDSIGGPTGGDEVKIRSFATMVSLVVLFLTFVPAQASAPMVRTQPGFYRMMLGDFEVTALNDGVVAYPTTRVLPTATPEQIKEGLVENGLTDPVGMSYNAFLINSGSKLILIDTGTGGKLQDSPEFRGTGRLIANLRAAGYQPEQIDEICVTHFGPDHLGGLTLGTERAFPNAMLHVPKAEMDIILQPANAPAWTKNWIPFWTSLIEPYRKAGRLSIFDGDVSLVPGIRALATHGHSPGHTSYIVENKGQKLIVLGDLVLFGAMQFAQPSLTSAFDSDPAAAVVQRKRILELAAEEDDWVAGGHLFFPAIGHVRARDGHYLWLPANYDIPQ